jgi:hypothetical protein
MFQCAEILLNWFVEVVVVGLVKAVNGAVRRDSDILVSVKESGHVRIQSKAVDTRS